MKPPDDSVLPYFGPDIDRGTIDAGFVPPVTIAVARRYQVKIEHAGAPAASADEWWEIEAGDAYLAVLDVLARFHQASQDIDRLLIQVEEVQQS